MATMLAASCGHDSHEDHDDIDDDDHGHEHALSSSLLTDEHQIAEFGIEFENVAPGSFRDVIKTSGQIEASASDVFTATARKNGLVTIAGNITDGAEVSSGEVIATVSSANLQGGDSSEVARVNLQTAKAEYDRLKPLYEAGLVTASAFREVERTYNEAKAVAGKNQGGGSSSVTAPGSGVIRTLYVKSGDYVDVGSPVASIVKNSRQILKVDLPVRESNHLPEIESANFKPEGSDRVLKLEDLDGKKLSGENAEVSNGYRSVYFSFSGNTLSTPGGFAEVYLLCGPRENVISVPRDALVEIQGNKYVYASDEDGDHFEKRLVKTGAYDGERVEIIEGLNEGEKVVSKGASIVRMMEISAVAPPAHTHNH